MGLNFEYIAGQAPLDEEGNIESSFEIITTHTENLIIEKFLTEEGAETRTYKFETNEKGHWVKQFVFVNDALHNTITREIKYYLCND